MSELKSNEILSQDIAYIKQDIIEIKQKLDSKYVSHETFDLIISGLRDADARTVKMALFFGTPLYGGLIALLFKIFAN